MIKDEYISKSRVKKKNVTKGRIRTNNRPTMQSLHSAERIRRIFSLFIKISYSLKQTLKRGVSEQTNKFRLFFFSRPSPNSNDREPLILIKVCAV